MTDLDRCSSCKEIIMWAVTEPGGKAIPMNPVPVPDGNMALRYVAGRLLARVLTTEDDLGAQALYHTHFMTCRYAGHHRATRRTA